MLGFLFSHRQELAERFGVCSLSVSGSMARNEAGPDCDVDLQVEFRETPGLAESMGFKLVDLMMEKALKPCARPLVDAEAIRVA